ncbi:hypothetical protein D3C72_2017600 [compost metagenome]
MLKRWKGTQKIMVLFNFSDQKQNLSIGETIQDWTMLLNSSSFVWNGPNEEINSLPLGEQITLFPESILILSKKDV